MATKLKVKLIRGVSGRPQKQKDTVRKLGLRRREQTVCHDNTPAVRGMINSVAHLVEVEVVEG
jgi:large subunit ribosomal protein L30